jgi:hypothetical protein
LHAFCLWGGFVDYVYSLYGILKGVEWNMARHEVHFLSMWIWTSWSCMHFSSIH